MTSIKLTPVIGAEADPMPGSAYAGSGILKRYAWADQVKIRRLSRTSLRFAQLAQSYPAACICVIRGDPVRARKARQLIDKGAPLPEIEAALGLERWMRSLPPEALRCATALQRETGDDAPDISRRLFDLIPDAFHERSRWLGAMNDARRFGSDRFVVWLATRMKRSGLVPETRRIELLAAYEYYSRERRSAAGALINARFHSAMSMRNAVAEATNWFLRGVFLLQRQRRQSLGFNKQISHIAGYRFSLLEDLDEITLASTRMVNCLRRYGPLAAIGDSLLVLIERDGNAVACMEVGVCEHDLTTLEIKQICGPLNARPDAAILWPTTLWVQSVAAHHAFEVEDGLFKGAEPSAFRRLFADYLAQLPIGERPDPCAWIPSREAADAYKCHGIFPTSPSPV